MSEQIDDALRMAALFRGFSGGYVTYDARLLSQAEVEQKVRQSMVKEPLKIDFFKAHLPRQMPIGIYVLDDNEQVSFTGLRHIGILFPTLFPFIML